jgi:hypothetical protein
MEILKTGLVITAAALAACAGGVALKAAGGAAYYYGQVSFYSPDGKLPYGNTESAVKREILDGGARIIETVTQPGPSHSMSPEEIVTTLKRRKKTLVYDASDAGGTFTGAVVFKDPELKTWACDIKLKAGGIIKGSGKILPGGIQMEKQLSGYGRPMSVKEDLKAVSEAEYKNRVSEMLPPPGAE